MQDGWALAETALVRAEWQASIFAPRPRRSQLNQLKLEALPAGRVLRVHVLRNHAFEYVASLLPVFARYAGYCPEVTLSAYDDALSSAPEQADVLVLWLDYTRYSELGPELATWLSGRILAMRASFDGPIVILDSPDAGESAQALNERLRQLLSPLPGVYVAPLASLESQLGSAFFDSRSNAIGSRLSDAAFVLAARELALSWLFAACFSGLKVIALDLDNTLVQGVLGEDGAQGVELTEAHRRLQAGLVELKERGLLLALVSRNERADVDALFESRKDFPLRREHFSSWAVGWGDKSRSLVEIAAELRVGLDTILFVDDNPGELLQVVGNCGSVRTLHAGADPGQTLAALAAYPGLFRYAVRLEDQLRARDLDANSARAVLAAHATSPEEYLRSLRVRLTFSFVSEQSLGRASELSNKTNQFNLALLRLSEPDVARRLDAQRSAVVLASLSDRLSDSGVICLIAARTEEQGLLVDDLCISCRALGRGLESLIIAEALRGLRDKLAEARIGFVWKRGPRNAPALDWLRQQFVFDEESEGGVVWSLHEVGTPELPVAIEWAHKP